MRQQGHKSAEITIRQGPDRAGSSNCWEHAPGYQQPVPGPGHSCPVVGDTGTLLWGCPARICPCQGKSMGLGLFFWGMPVLGCIEDK